jgi:hypothetical protein
MQFGTGVKRRMLVCVAAGALAMGLLTPLAFSAVPAKQTVDQGSFGVFMHGQRVATETFSIHQDETGSSVV